MDREPVRVEEEPRSPHGAPAARENGGLSADHQQALVETVADLDVVTELINRNVRQEDIGRILLKLGSDDRDPFTSKLSELLRKTSALLLVSRRLSDSLSIDVLLPRMVELISDFLDAERCTIFLHDRERDELYTRAAVGLQQEVRFPSGLGIAGAVFKSGQPALIPDAYADPRFNAEVDQRTGFRTRNILCVPLRHTSQGEALIVGVAEVLNKRRGAFSEEDQKLLDALNSQAAAAFVNALLHEEVARARAEEAQLLEVTAAISSELELRPLLQKIMTTVAALLEADRASLFVHDRASDELWALAGKGEGLEEVRCPADAGIAGHVFKTAATVNAADAYTDARFNPAVDRRTGYRTGSLLCMPVLDKQGRPIAVAQVLNKKGGVPFGRSDERRLAAFCCQASIAMENAQLFQELKRVVRRLRSLLDASRALATAVDLDSQLEVILTRAADVMEAERASLFVYDEATRSLSTRSSGATGAVRLRIPLGSGIAGHVARTGELVNIPDAYADPRFDPEVDRETSYRTRSMLCAPMFTHDGKLTGVLQVLNKTNEAAFSADDEALMEAFASHAAIALDRARLIEAFVEKQRIEESLRLGHEIQMGMLPTTFPRQRRFELSARLVPARSVGGDLYDFLVQDERLWFLVADVSGKGVSAALFMAVAKTLFRASIEGGSDPAAMLARVNRELCRDNERGMFVTAFVGCLDAWTGEVAFTNAGHNLPYQLGAGGSVGAVAGAHGIALGIVEDYPYQTGRLRLEPGEGLYLYTDGVTEALSDGAEQFSAARLEAYLASVACEAPARVVDGTFEQLQAFVGAAQPSDDIAVLALRYQPATTGCEAPAR
jgi:serine phosphatase RsbU (regulator of sigma subunit)